ncbi:polysaccharide deacetylase family protein [Aerococcus sanguinicola]|nr:MULTISPECIES: polysaccharide deacetylase family protein [Aerococcus]AMB94346.1 hypothetical protein AWM72_06025 [Aerococcus sanguinicola]MDK7049867.1 polysaccharide deacetylase family protein [Aerococcus sanguinicola]OFT93487.1 hypothetical protein HMPREF3090_06940 [Aerococcus sp. HMSC23C02]
MKKRNFLALLALLALCLFGCKQESEAETDQPYAKNEAQTERQAPKYYIDPATYSVRPIGDANPNVVLLTFDDVPRPLPTSNAPTIAKHLEDAGVKGLFFANGMYLEDQEGRDAIKAIADKGHVIGNHTQTHANLNDLTAEQTREEIQATNEAVEGVTGDKVYFFRPPFGSTNAALDGLMEEFGMLAMNWSFGYDWVADYQDAEALTKQTLESEFLQPGANILMHDTQWTAEALPAIIQGLKDQGYQIVDPNEIARPEEMKDLGL